MKTYRGDYYHPETFEKSEVETKIPMDLVNEVEQVLGKMDGYDIIGTLINPEDKSVTFGIIDVNDRSLKYRISISPPLSN
jgi:hypothetical protein